MSKLEKAEYDAKRAKYDKAAEDEKTKREANLLEVHVRQRFPQLREINEAYKQMLDTTLEKKEVENPES